MIFDVLISGGWVVDGTGAPPFRADVAVTGGSITAVGRIEGVAATRVHATGRYVLPGLIDCHSHADAAIHDPAVQLALLRQGVTTVVLGQDGLSYAPVTRAPTAAYVRRYFAAVNGAHPQVDGPVSVAELLAGYDGRAPVNAAYLVPHGTIRHDVLGGAERPADRDELRAMRERLERGLADGAAGLSSGLEYAPARAADTGELAHLCEALGALPYVTHMRRYGARAAEGLAETTEIGRLADVAVHVSHLHGVGLRRLVADARAEGADLTFDTYPYLRGSTLLAMVVLPPGIPAADPVLAVKALREVRLSGSWDRLTLSHAPGFEWAEGRTIAEAAPGDPAEFARTLLIETRLEAGCVMTRPDESPEAEEANNALTRDPGHLGGSDGIFVGGHPHPRAYGAFARMLAQRVLPWELAAVHLAGHPARRFGLSDRGLVRAGLAADLVVVDPARVADNATYERPRELATGIDDVIVNGVPVLAGGALTGAASGRALSPR